MSWELNVGVVAGSREAAGKPWELNLAPKVGDRIVANGRDAMVVAIDAIDYGHAVVVTYEELV